LSEAPQLRIAIKAQGQLRDQLVSALSGRVDIVSVEDDHDAVLVATHASAGNQPVLTPRELEVLELMSEGVSNSEIASRLGISFHTAKFHVRAVTDKLDATGRTDAVISAVRKGLLQL
jgi:DNA-binding CsgD family transcriptional regulator